MELKEMIKVMQHFKDGGEVECKSEFYSTWEECSSPIWNWFNCDYRIKEQKEKVTIEKWLCEYEKCEHLSGSTRFFILEKAVPFKFAGKKVKLLETYEVEL